MPDLTILVGDSLEQVRAIADEQGYQIIEDWRFDTLDTEYVDGANYGHLGSNASGAVAIAKR